MDSNMNRVYINPNFNRAPNRAAIVRNPVYFNNYYHVNPSFTQHISSVQPSTNLKRKIYVNPNFIKSSIENKQEINIDKIQLEDSISVSNENLNSTNSNIANLKPPITIPRPSSKSRYCLIRNNNSKMFEKDRPDQETCTIKISKYKSIPIHNFKNNLQIIKEDTATKQTYCKPNNFKLIRNNIKLGSTTNTTIKLPQKPNTFKIKRSGIDLNLQVKLKVTSGTRKKNNIPCRLFTKYGKCLRNLYGTCEYLHDRKHVSVCRKFIRGICHDKGCLLSHELSSKKMPTCFFYLKGMCMKEGCPYLHVKLSEKSKVCLDFLKGYCDKGDNCLHRHVKPHPNKSKNNKGLVNSPSKHKTNRIIKHNISKSVKINQSRRLKEQVQVRKLEKNSVNNCTNEKSKDETDCRYFREDLHNEDIMCEILKPTRCKLGTLPSFIQL